MTGKQLDGRIAVITGAASGIGAAIAALFQSEGARVASLDLTSNGNADCDLKVDVRSEPQLRDAYFHLEKTLGVPDIMVHAAARCPRGGSLETSVQDFADIYDVNVLGAVRLLQLCVPGMRRKGRGSVVLLSSINASFATPSHVAYAASKAALNNLTLSSAVEFAPDGIRVNAIAPASIDTPMLRASYAGHPDGDRALVSNQQRHPIARFGTAQEVAELALFLVSERSRWVTGAVYPLDGGASATRRQ
ncbi:MAG: SDR family oxidoreductase [Rhodoferax sp.]|nr:SDR family oxidoreductase [Rhodoferax sp.]